MGTLSGQVVYKGQPVDGVLNIHDKAHGEAAMTKIESGRFAFPDPLPAGEYAAYVLPPAPEPTDPRKGPPKKVNSNIPAKARDMATSGLKVTIKEGPNEVSLEIQD